MQFFTAVAALSLPLAWATKDVGQVVETSSGPVNGHAAIKHPEVSEYLGIPYAQPPVGDLRFAPPVEYVGSSLLDGASFGFSCPPLPSEPVIPSPEMIEASNVTDVGLRLFALLGNPGVVYSEDCLSLNVWSKPQSGEPHKAVMVYIHGGAFSGGTSDMPLINGAALADQEDVIVVTLNYRLAVLGFPGNPNAQNNLGFLDQRLAMEWVRDNIANFGGDPKRITLFGHSAGAISVDFYAYAFASDPIAAGIIEQSGTATGFGLPYNESTSAAAWYTVTEGVGCGNASTDPEKLLKCMRNVDYNSILEAVPMDGLNAFLSAFGPTVDNTIVFPDYSKQPAACIPMLIGSSDYESGQLRTQLAMANMTFPDTVWDEMDLAAYTCPAGARANASVADNNPTWRYRYHGVFPNTDISWQGGAYHGAELTLLFGTTFEIPESTPEEIEVEAYLQGAWAAFAKDPVNGLTTYEDGWPLYDPAKETLVRLSYDNEVGTNLALPEMYDAECADASLEDLFCDILGYC